MTRPDNDLLREAKRSLRHPVLRRVLRCIWHELTKDDPGGFLSAPAERGE